MSKRRGVRSPWVPREKKKRRPAPPALLESTRREFVKGVGATAILLGAQPFSPSALAAGLAAGMEERTVFFNFSHIKGPPTTHFLYVAGRKYRMTPIQERPDVLAFEKRRNEFLRSVPDAKITHHVQGVLIPLDGVSLAYTTCNEDTSAGTWAMTAMHFTVPKSSVSHAYLHARLGTPSGPLRLSGKRLRYKVRPAMTEQDLAEELSLVDTTSHAEALVGLHPDILCVEPNNGAKIQSNYVSPDGNTQFLGDQLDSMGPATTEDANTSGGWATLNLLGIDPKTNLPFKKSDGLLNIYYPDWSPEVDSLVGPAISTVHPSVKNDETLGSDLTGFNLNDPTSPVPPEKFFGKMWARHDGNPTVDQTLARLVPGGPGVTFPHKESHPGLQIGDLDDSDVTLLGDGRFEVTLDNVSNWFLRWLGLWVQFLGPDGKTVIAANQLNNDTIPAQPGPYPRPNIDDPTDNALFLGVVPNPFAVAGIPIYPPGRFAPAIRIPTSASTMRLFYTGIGQSGSRPESPTGIYGAGIGMTVFFNYGVVGLFMASGVSTYAPTFKLAMSIGGGALAQEIQAIIGTEINNAGFLSGLLKFAMGLLKVIVTKGASALLGVIVTQIYTQLVIAQIVDSIPVAGQIARAVAAGIGIAQLAETSIEVACSPAAYVFDVVETHDLSIKILPDGAAFPQFPNYTTYYKVSYLFDRGTAHTRDGVDVPDPTVPSILITFPGVPRGGQVNITIGFYVRQDRTPPGLNDWCAAKGQTGLVDNIPDQAPDLTVSNIKTPIQSTTQYVHARKTALADAPGNPHFWNFEAPPPIYVPPPGNPSAGLGDFRSITVRQGTSNPPQEGYVGYAWQAFSDDVKVGCSGGPQGQFDNMANLNTDAGNFGRNAENGYINSAKICGYNPGVRMAYNLLTHKSVNMYLDTTKLMIRPVTLDPIPSFAAPSSKQAFGKLNMVSTRCLLHPAGHIVSINNGNNKIETLQLPSEALTDDDASDFFLARTLSGVGTRPGLITSPVAAVISPDGVILVLEAEKNNRIQAFDLGANPVPFFKGQTAPGAQPYFLQLDETLGNTYLDLAIEFTGYLYVLSKDANNVHRLDIYNAAQSGTKPICTTFNVNGAKLAVDFWRAAYTLNYEVLQLPGGGLPGFTEPSVSLWQPTPPHEGLDRRDPRVHSPRK